MRTAIIGDIHGCLDEFRALVDRIRPNSPDEIICLGDFLDKGPKGPECVRFARESGFRSVLGNHEERHVRWRRNQLREKEQPGYRNGMSPQGLLHHERLDDEDFAWLKSLPSKIVVKPWLIAVHGGFLPKVPIADQPEDKIIRVRWIKPTGEYASTSYEEGWEATGLKHWTDVYDHAPSVVYGHEAFSLSRPRFRSDKNGTFTMGIDTGCVHGGRLTAWVFNEDEGIESTELIQVAAKKCYEAPRRPIPA